MDGLKESIWETFQEFVNKTFGFSLSDDQLNLLRIYLRELLVWNEKFNLVSFKSSEELLWRHFADSLSVLKFASKYLTNNFKIADIGTGAGFPGIPVKIALPETGLTLIESIQKKCAFLQNIKEKCSLQNTVILNDRAENIGQDNKHREKYDLVLARAAAKFSPNLEFALPLVKPGGRFVVYKTEASAFGDEGISSAEKALSLLGGEFTEHFIYTLPGQNMTYCLLVFEKIRITPKEYPRKTGVPEKKPL